MKEKQTKNGKIRYRDEKNCEFHHGHRIQEEYFYDNSRQNKAIILEWNSF